MSHHVKLKERLIATQIIKQEEISKTLQILTDLRAPHPPPTEDEVVEMLIRMKKRWGLIK
ncbi:MAG TPA: hypothetical protein PKA10_16865 [Selenomonadales bacterium]|nr:hypothetical protein [Selenomonadales bacterium]